MPAWTAAPMPVTPPRVEGESFSFVSARTQGEPALASLPLDQERHRLARPDAPQRMGQIAGCLELLLAELEHHIAGLQELTRRSIGVHLLDHQPALGAAASARVKAKPAHRT